MYTVKIDKRGKILIPSEIRKSLKLFEGQKMVINTTCDFTFNYSKIEVKPYEYVCRWCGKDIPEGSEYGSCEECTRKNTKRIY